MSHAGPCAHVLPSSGHLSLLRTPVPPPDTCRRSLCASVDSLFYYTSRENEVANDLRSGYAGGSTTLPSVLITFRLRNRQRPNKKFEMVTVDVHKGFSKFSQCSCRDILRRTITFRGLDFEDLACPACCERTEDASSHFLVAA